MFSKTFNLKDIITEKLKDTVDKGDAYLIFCFCPFTSTAVKAKIMRTFNADRLDDILFIHFKDRQQMIQRLSTARFKDVDNIKVFVYLPEKGIVRSYQYISK